MEGLDIDIAQRIIDFASGSCYAIDGHLQKISHFIFIITPASVIFPAILRKLSAAHRMSGMSDATSAKTAQHRIYS